MPHKPKRNSPHSQRRQLYEKARDELKVIFDKAFRDTEINETVATHESVLLDVDQGEVLKTPTYSRRFDVFSHPR